MFLLSLGLEFIGYAIKVYEFVLPFIC